MKKNKLPNWAISGHKAPTTRREFLAHGLIPFVAASFLPSPLRLLNQESWLESAVANSLSCQSGNNSDWIPFIQVDLAGGAALMANYVPTDREGQLLSSYSLMGLGTTPSISREFGQAPFFTNSGFLRGLNSAVDSNIKNKVSMFAVCAQSRDDSSENLMSMVGLVSRATRSASLLPTLGNINSPTAGRHMAAIIAPDSPLVVNNFNSLSSAIGYSAQLNTLTPLQKQKLTKLVSQLNEKEAKRLSSQPGLEKLLNQIGCSGQTNQQLVADGSSLIDPRGQSINTTWGINASTAADNADLVQASIAFNTLNGNSGPSTIALGGYDYHGQSRAETDLKDEEAGRLIGRIIKSADIMQKPVYIAVSSDGSVGSTNSTNSDSSFASDRGPAGVLYAFVYRPEGRVNFKHHQIGHFEAGQLASEQSVVGTNIEKAASSIVANYLALHEKTSLINTQFGREIFSRSELEKILLVG